VTNKIKPGGAMLMYVIVAIVALSLSFVFVKALHHTDSIQPRAPMHDPK
jgi:hypothetical protein